MNYKLLISNSALKIRKNAFAKTENIIKMVQIHKTTPLSCEMKTNLVTALVTNHKEQCPVFLLDTIFDSQSDSVVHLL